MRRRVTAKPKPPKKTVTERFWSHVDVRGENDCWEWTAALTTRGYGHFSVGGGVFTSAHRYSAVIHGMDVTGALVCHTCDNTKCVNPNHLFVGTHADNTRDMVRKLRFKRINCVKVQDIPDLLLSSEPITRLAARLGISRETIYRLRRRYGSDVTLSDTHCDKD